MQSCYGTVPRDIRVLSGKLYDASVPGNRDIAGSGVVLGPNTYAVQLSASVIGGHQECTQEAKDAARAWGGAKEA
jgi:hypothetical protein